MKPEISVAEEVLIRIEESPVLLLDCPKLPLIGGYLDGKGRHDVRVDVPRVELIELLLDISELSQGLFRVFQEFHGQV